MAELQEKLYAQDRWTVLLIFQALDAAGKDSVIKHVMSGLNPQGCEVHSFKAPSTEELDHDFLWRIHRQVPGNGEIVIFNRSHYEDVLAVRVRQIVPEKVWRPRYQQINDFERLLSETGTTILKFFLHISKEEQKERLQARLDNPEKRWKFRLGDLEDRALWDEYTAAYEEALARTSTDHAPWYVVPADRKWYRNLVIGTILVEALEGLDIRQPEAEEDLSGVVVE